MHSPTQTTLAPSGAVSCRTAPDLPDVAVQPSLAAGEGRQLSIDDAIAAGEHGMGISLASAQKADPEFKEKAKAAFIRFLAAAPGRQMPGEVLVELAKRHGIVPAKGDRAFGGVFYSLSAQKVIRCLRSDLPRKRGHGTSGGKLWLLCQ